MGRIIPYVMENQQCLQPPAWFTTWRGEHHIFQFKMLRRCSKSPSGRIGDSTVPNHMRSWDDSRYPQSYLRDIHMHPLLSLGITGFMRFESLFESMRRSPVPQNLTKETHVFLLNIPFCVMNIMFSSHLHWKFPSPMVKSPEGSMVISPFFSYSDHWHLGPGTNSSAGRLQSRTPWRIRGTPAPINMFEIYLIYPLVVSHSHWKWPLVTAFFFNCSDNQLHMFKQMGHFPWLKLPEVFFSDPHVVMGDQPEDSWSKRVTYVPICPMSTLDSTMRSEPLEQTEIFKFFPSLPSGKHTKSYWKWHFIVDLPIKNCDFP